MLFDTFKIILVSHPLLGLGGPSHTGEPDHGSPGHTSYYIYYIIYYYIILYHTIIGDPGGDPAPSQGPTSSICRGHEAALLLLLFLLVGSNFTVKGNIQDVTKVTGNNKTKT